MKRVLSVVVALAGMGTLEAADSPSLEACARYAEADHAYEAAFSEHRAFLEAALREARDAYGAVYRAAVSEYEAASMETAADVAAYLEAAAQEAEAAYEAAMREPRAFLESVMQGPEADREASYRAIYAEDGEVRSEVPEVMAKLRDGHRKRCRDLHGL